MNRLASPHAPYANLAFSSTSSLDHPADITTITSHAAASSTAQARRPSMKAAPGVALFVPIHYERRYAYPLLVWLHGHGSSERELRRMMPNVSVRNYVGAAARGTSLGRDVAAGFAWPQTDDGVEAAAENVAQCIEQAKRRYHIHPGRIFLAGRGTGGTMALRLALQFSLPVAGAASLGGALPRGNCPLARVNEARKLPLMLMSCRGSEIYPPQQVADDLRLLHAAGCQLAIREYLCGDELFTDMFADMDQWLMANVCGSGAKATVA
jgi:phospholipase/carboxylesterase